MPIQGERNPEDLKTKHVLRQGQLWDQTRHCLLHPPPAPAGPSGGNYVAHHR